MASENIDFHLELFATFWDKVPTCKVSINDIEVWSGNIDGTKDKPTVIKFNHQLEADQEYNLKLDRQGKDNSQTIVENGEMVKDQMLHIKSILIDEIDIGSLVYMGVYKPEYPEPWQSEQIKAGIELPETQKFVTEMGHNGTWTFTFRSPLYMWLLENLY
tara:strand:- start:352 stop:831 length:480 start_codon:yes stop_codon:yes gene_type:complete